MTLSLDAQHRTSVGASGLGAGASSGAPSRIRRAAKLSAAFGMLGLGVYAMLVDAGSIASDNAVVSAYLVELRTPIEGYVSALQRDVGGVVPKGSTLAKVDNPRVDGQRLADLRAQLAKIRADREAVTALAAELTKLREDLTARAEAHAVASRARLMALETAEERELAALNARRDLARRDFERKLALGMGEAVTRAEVERARSALDVAEKEAAAQAARLASVRTQAESVALGVIAEPGANDVAYSRQRADEISIRLAELGRTISALAADEAVTSERLDVETGRIALLREAAIVAPSDGLVWKYGASNGERLSAGDMAVQIVDCTAAFIVAAIPQDRVPDVEVGAMARFRLAGERTELQGRVMNVTGGRPGEGDRHLAAVPAAERSAMATVRIDVPMSRNAADGCLVGRTARVLLPATGGGWLEWVLTAGGRLDWVPAGGDGPGWVSVGTEWVGRVVATVRAWADSVWTGVPWAEWAARGRAWTEWALVVGGAWIDRVVTTGRPWIDHAGAAGRAWVDWAVATGSDWFDRVSQRFV
ncbi:MAG TPA: HlyD family efflux transporter periplasmic adaptor subunit [Azospirillaceae bacterium]|nr:HlyD family efflux transporter periplasmic adaptor subunit [Azospirillaceae bacterium]